MKKVEMYESSNGCCYHTMEEAQKADLVEQVRIYFSERTGGVSWSIPPSHIIEHFDGLAKIIERSIP